MKFRRCRALAEPLGELMAGAARADPIYRRAGLIAPVPLYPRRLRERGFNQSELLATTVARRLGLAIDAGLLRRIRPTSPQTDLEANARRLNVRDAFAASEVPHEVIVLVDDVISTGSTVRECSRTLRAAGAAEVLVLALARAVRS